MDRRLKGTTPELFQVYQIDRVRALGNGSAYFGNTMKR